MAALTPGTPAPDFSLPTSEGEKFSLRDALQRGPVLLAFFKISCPTCQYALPFVERLYQAYDSANFTVAGVSQNSKADTTLFQKEYGITFPAALDELHRYPVSNAYGLTNVPTLFWIAQDGKIELTSVGWERSGFEALNQKAAETGNGRAQPLFHPDEQVAAFRAG